MRIKRWLTHKKNNRKGFSLTELLAAVLILSMVSAVVAGGIPVAKDAYEKITLSANAQVLLSTAISTLRNELSTASEIRFVDKENKPDPNGEYLEYYNSSIKNYCTIDNDNTNKDAYLTWYSRSSSKIRRRLVSSGKLDDELYVVFSSIAYNDGIITITGLRVVNSNSSKVYAKMREQGNADNDGKESILKIRVIVP